MEEFEIFLTGAACGAGNAHPSGAPDFTSDFHRGSCCPVICVSLCHVIILSFGFWVLIVPFVWLLSIYIFYFLQAIESKNGEPFDLDSFIQPSISNVICFVVFGKRFEYTDERFINMLGLFNKSMRLFGPSGLINFFPFLKYVPGDPCKGKLILKQVDEIYKFLDELIQEQNETYDDGHIRDYIDA